MKHTRLVCCTLFMIVIAAVLVAAPRYVEANWLIDWRLTANSYVSYITQNNARSLACDESGNLHLVWYQSRGEENAWNIFYRKRLVGVTWAPVVRLSSDLLSCSVRPSIAAGGGDSLHVVWEEGIGLFQRIHYRLFDGISWGTETELTGGVGTAFSPSIAVAPDGHVHVVWRDTRDDDAEIYHKVFDGSTWSSDERLTTSSGVSSDPSIAVDPSGNLHVVWQDDRDGAYEVYYKTHDGTGWGADERLTTDAGGSWNPCVTAGDDGDVHVVWSNLRSGDHEIYYRKKTGITWQAEERLTSATGDSRYPCAALSDSGHVHVVWQDARDGNDEIYHKVHDGTSWGADERLTNEEEASQSPSVLVDDSGDLHVVWHDERDGNAEIYWKWGPRVPLPPPAIVSITPDSTAVGEGISITDLAGANFLDLAVVRLIKMGQPSIQALNMTVESSEKITCDFSLSGAQPGYWDLYVENPDGQSDTLFGRFLVSPGLWGPDMRLTTADGESETSRGNARCITTDAANNPHVVWHDKRDGNFEVYYKYFNGADWEADERISMSGVAASCPSIAFDHAGNIHVVWYDFRHRADGNWEIYYRMSDGLSWGPEERLTVFEEDSALPSLAVDSADNLHVVWYDAHHGPPEIYYKQYDGSWGPNERLTDAGGNEWSPAIAVDSSDRLHVVWHGDRYGDYEIFHKMFDGLNWQADERLTSTSGVSANVTLAADMAGRLHIAWKDERDGNYEIYYKSYDGSTWGVDVRLTDDPADAVHPSIVSDPSGQVHVAWQDKRHVDGEIYYRYFDGIEWGPEQRLTASTGKASRPSLASDNLGRIHLVWFDDRDGESEIYYKLMDPGLISGFDDIATGIPSMQLTVTPNPAGRNAVMRFGLRHMARAEISVYDLAGRLVWKSDLGILDPGPHHVKWKGVDISGRPVASGIYFAELRAGNRRDSSKLIILR